MRREQASQSDGVGLVETKIVRLDLPPDGFRLECGDTLPELHVAYETYGTLSPARDNVVCICHALSGDAHVAGYHALAVAGESSAREISEEWGASDYAARRASRGWWDEMIGPGRGIDTRYYHVVCANILGGCKGTTGPGSTDPRTGRPYGSTFPKISIGDIVEVHRLLLRQLGIERLACALGGSLGGMQALEWAIRHPETIDRCICIACGASLSAQALAFDIVARSAITSDPDWQGGDYYGTGRQPARGLALARKLGHITYLSPEMMTRKFGREKTSAPPSGEGEAQFEVESYLDHQGAKFVGRFDANSYLQIARAIDEYDLLERFGSPEKAFEPLQAKLLVVALSADWLFPPEQSVELANGLLRAGKRVSYCDLFTPHGHDAFLVDIEHLAEVIRAFLPWVREEDSRADPAGGAGGPDARKKQEFEAITGMVRPGLRVLDLGCGNGALLSILRDRRQVSGLGVDIDLNNVIDVIDRGHDIFQANIDSGLAMIPDGSYDCAILSDILHLVRKPRFVLREMLRVAGEGIVAFPNGGKWSNRLRLALLGRAPIPRECAAAWHETSNIHFFTLKDFMDLCAKDNIRVLDVVCIPDGAVSGILLGLGLRNLGADRVIVRIARG